MAAEPGLSLQAVADALRAFFQLVSSPEALPEFPLLQARLLVIVHACLLCS
jgi:hypothetical protein